MKRDGSRCRCCPGESARPLPIAHSTNRLRSGCGNGSRQWSGRCSASTAHLPASGPADDSAEAQSKRRSKPDSPKNLPHRTAWKYGKGLPKTKGQISGFRPCRPSSSPAYSGPIASHALHLATLRLAWKLPAARVSRPLRKMQSTAFWQVRARSAGEST